MVTMENEQLQTPPPISNSGATATTPSSSGRQAGPQISVYSGIPDRQTVQVIQQALHRQPNTAAQYLQQMYAAQQQHLMFQTAALQQQHLGSTQLQSLAAIQQASLAANRQSSSSSSNGATQTPTQQPTINLAASPAAAQLINRAQSVNSAAATASGLAQQAVLLGNTSSPTLTASQAQMYLRAQMLIFTPTVAAVQPEGTATSVQPPTTTAPQVQNSAARSQQAVTQTLSSSPGQQLPTLAIKPAPNNSTPLSSTSSPAAPAKGAKEGLSELVSEHLRKGEGGGGGGSSSNGTAGTLDVRGSSTLSRTGPPTSTHPLIAPAYSQIQTQQLGQTPPTPPLSKALPHQFVLQQQLQPRPPQLQGFPAPTSSLNTPPAPLPACQSPGQHKPTSSQGPQHTPPAPGPPPAPGLQRPEGGPLGRATGCVNHSSQRKFQPTSAVILQLQPPVRTLPLSLQDNSRKDTIQAGLPPKTASTPPLAPPKPPVSEGTGPAPHDTGGGTAPETKGPPFSVHPPAGSLTWLQNSLQSR